MGTPATAPLGGFGATATAAAGWTYWSGNGLPKLNHSLARVAGGDGGVVPAAGGNVGNLTREVKNWPALLILVIIALTVGGNILVILAVSLEKKLQNATNFFLRSLAVADMLVGILVMPVSLINILYDYAWPLPSALCPIWIYLDVLFSTASIMHLCAISLDRYVAIRNPIEHSRFNSRTKAMMKIAAVWTISIGVSTPIPVIGLLNEDNVFVNGSCVLNEERFILMGSFVAFFIPLVIMVVTYGLTVQVLQRQATVFLCEANASSQQPLQAPAVTDASQKHPDLPELKAESESGILLGVSASESVGILPGSEATSQLSSPAAGPGRGAAAGCHGRRGMMQAIKNERRASKVLGIVFFLFLVMWCPFFITNVTLVLCGGSCNESLLHELLNVFVWVGYISSGVNPLVYTLFNKTYRRAFSSYIHCRYNAGADAPAASRGFKNPTAPLSSSHAVTPPLGEARRKVCADQGRHSDCRNGGRAARATGEDGTRAGSDATPSLYEFHDIGGALSETEAETEEQELSLVGYSPASTVHTSSV
ncbi:5-hydroxytryptamine receptor 2C-like isoform X1 [Syngnathoides biaculeatus]|uniref:5-hydroxytryptamine receptor 2C-like isoform X1 n=1 Tax=Syngnathoides biaculeatus TaxID=300417 RepID=UPI002ADD8189|nr:5-hydroxytryptamine receptor 2C-like isoform X1 [Syngnathoides biaculeatus]XP_061664189.1 5-hydroxytryptamine receptor 2C-like isoform X1 [Syngnathoides biaculeatus]XP_061664190.1 5-hydroxytryptamine receptor 2C-like isoform X1 [Syngnathoides biaculeatus]XP_061664191.1 5-hydroxytryptamine receptor 2C-like isoform X1 [Syngnathoides biaculeatus]XP_061664192.1 5-hydroxytryptamine receptor 2C-like isoform X1 [Syngnathoides biaculeatus]XP_061664193.1 5-hydroxytryptamine receptor 2C-like isoform 